MPCGLSFTASQLLYKIYECLQFNLIVFKPDSDQWSRDGEELHVLLAAGLVRTNPKTPEQEPDAISNGLNLT